MTDSDLLPRDDRDSRKTELGLLPRLIAAGWFAAAALIPIVFFFVIFSGEGRSPDASRSSGVWFFVGLPVSLAAFYGFVIGCRILDRQRNRSPFRVMLLGIAVAAFSYLSMPAIHMMAAILFPQPPTIWDESLSRMFYWMLLIYGVGAILVGWLVVFAGAVAGLMLDWLSGKERLWKMLTKAPRVTKRRAYGFIGVAAIILISANGILLAFPSLLSATTRLFFQILDRLD